MKKRKKPVSMVRVGRWTSLALTVVKRDKAKADPEERRLYVELSVLLDSARDVVNELRGKKSQSRRRN